MMERHGIEWEQLGTHDEHLSVMDYKKVQRVKEVAELDETISVKQVKINSIDKTFEVKQAELDKVQSKLQIAKTKEKFITENIRRYDDDPDFQLDDPKPLMSAKTYQERIAAPLVRKLKDVIRSILHQFFDRTRELKTALDNATRQVDGLSNRLKKYEPEMARLQDVERDYKRLRRGVGDNRSDEIIKVVQTQGIAEKRTKSKQRIHER